MTKVLISAVGSSDPIRDMYDGPIMHIVRYIKPDVIYLFYTAEMEERDSQDNKVEYALKRLGESIGAVPVIKKFETHIEDAHISETVSPYVKQLYDLAFSENPECDCYINLTSATQQIGSCFRLLALTGERAVTTLEVFNPNKAANFSVPITQKLQYDLEEEIECNNDNLPDAKCRMHETNLNEYRKHFLVSKVKQLVLSYDYRAALALLTSDGAVCAGDIPELVGLLQMASQRYDLNFSHDKQCLSIGCFPVKKEGVMEIFEYYLKIRTLFSREEYCTGILYISPLLTALCKRYLLLTYDFDVNKCLATSKKKNISKKDYKLDKELCIQHYPQYKNTFDKMFSYSNGKRLYCTAGTLIQFIENAHEVNKKTGAPIYDVDMLKKLRDVEGKLRNELAHTVTYISKEAIYKYTELKTNEITKLMESCISELYAEDVSSPDYFKSYEHMNDMLISKCDEML